MGAGLGFEVVESPAPELLPGLWGYFGFGQHWALSQELGWESAQKMTQEWRAEWELLAGEASSQVALGAGEMACQQLWKQEGASGATVTVSLVGKAAGWPGAPACSEG